MAPTQDAVLQEVLAQQPDAAVIHEAAFYGTWPQLLGAPGTPPRRTVGLGIFPLTLGGAELTMMGPPSPRTGLDVQGAAAAFNADSPPSSPAPPRTPSKSWRDWARRPHCP
ncbi:hypothetical protein [Streptomyces sp. NPDC017991]|uniref:hypothetical protein n=1 Tax=Streptomyces sp. NPDC017991 TaxID=3365026 RepID=UPI0037B0CDCA